MIDKVFSKFKSGVYIVTTNLGGVLDSVVKDGESIVFSKEVFP